MKPTVLLETVKVPNGNDELKLYEHDGSFSIKVKNIPLMNSRMHHSEDELARLTIEKLRSNKPKKILIGGLGMGFTLVKALETLGKQDKIDIAELSEDIISWNRKYFSMGDTLDDPRVNLINGDVLDIMRSNQRSYDAILLDVDNGPEGLTKDDNNRIYSNRGLKAGFQALKIGGILAVWSSGDSDIFDERLKKSNFIVEKWKVSERPNGKGGKHLIWFASKRSGR